MQGKGYCECGCGGKTAIATKTQRSEGRVKGQPARFIRGHAIRVPGNAAKLIAAERWTVQEDGCWVWRRRWGSASDYVRIELPDGSRQVAHRAIYEELVGPIPPGLELHHRCFNKRCVNPDHLQLLTKSEHMSLHMALRSKVPAPDRDAVGP